MVTADGQGVPLGSTLTSSSQAKVKLFKQTLDELNVPQPGLGRPKGKPKRFITDKCYNSDFKVLQQTKARAKAMTSSMVLN